MVSYYHDGIHNIQAKMGADHYIYTAGFHLGHLVDKYSRICGI